ncbi:MAG: ABC transporter permease, partial [Candidatus Fimadaptatus sp.]
MLKYTLKRLAMAIPVVLGIVTIVFVLMRVFSTNPAYLLLGQHATAEKVAELSEYLGLNEPIWKQYLIYLKQMFSGDLGNSLFSGQPVMKELLERLPATIELALFAVAIASVIGITLGVICAVKQNSWLDRICQVGGLVGVSLPRFWLGLMLIIAFAVNLGWLPVSGRFDFMARPQNVTGFMILDSIITGDWKALGSTLRYLA